MTDENGTETQGNTVIDLEKEKDDEGGQGRQRSTIGFPYSPLNDAVEVAQAIHDHVGHGDCDDSQLSVWMGQSAKSSGYRVQISAARMFGVIETDGAGRHKLTLLGRQIVDPTQARAARARAFLSVPLYAAAFEKYKGTVLPPSAALEKDFVGLGVAEKQKDRARQVFERAAEQSGFFEHGKNRLVMPGIAARDDDRKDVKDDSGSGGGGGDGTKLNLDPLLMALLQKIPPKSEEWPAAKRVRWFRTFAMNVSQIYDDDDNPVELKIDASKGSE